MLSQEQPTQEISKIDGQPIVNLNAADFYKSNVLGHMRDKLVATQGRAIIRGLNDRIQLSSIQKGYSIAVKDLGQYRSSKTGAPDVGSTHLRVTEDDGETEDFMLTLRPYIQHPKRMAAKGKSGMRTLSAGNTYLALSPDRFYLEDDENGNEQWPVTFPAVSLSDSSDKIMVTFNKDGLVSTSKVQDKGTTQSAGETQLVFIEGTPVVGPNYVAPPCPDCGGGGGGGTSGGGDDGNDGSGSYCTEVNGRGSTSNGSNSGLRTYFTVNNVRLWATGDGDGAAELQMFVKNDDDYDGECFHRSYKYRFDTVVRSNPVDIAGLPNDNTIIEGADKNNNSIYYRVPDINHDDINYDFSINRFKYDALLDYWETEYVDYFPVFDLTSRPGPWRLVLSDDDKDYQDFSRRQQSDFAQDIWTYDMASGIWSEVFTGFSTDRKTSGSSDDPIRESGVRRITYDNVNRAGGFGGAVVASKDYSSGSFEYRFSLINY